MTGWASFFDDEATAGDVLSMDAVRDSLVEGGLAVDIAWSPGLRLDGLQLERADPDAYTHLLFCGPAHGRQVLPSRGADRRARHRDCARAPGERDLAPLPCVHRHTTFSGLECLPCGVR